MMKNICKRSENLHYDTIRERRSRSMKKLTIKLNPDELTEELLSETMNAKKPFKAKRGTPKYDMSKFKIIKPMDDE